MVRLKRKNISRDAQRADNGKTEEPKRRSSGIYCNRFFHVLESLTDLQSNYRPFTGVFIMELQKRKRGRPCGVTPEKLDKLEKGFMLGLNDTECCLYADISTSAFYRYLEKNPKFREKKEVLKKKPLLKKRKTTNNY